jgi:hypothetical protein
MDAELTTALAIAQRDVESRQEALARRDAALEEQRQGLALRQRSLEEEEQALQAELQLHDEALARDREALEALWEQQQGASPFARLTQGSRLWVAVRVALLAALATVIAASWTALQFSGDPTAGYGATGGGLVLGWVASRLFPRRRRHAR